MLSTESQQKIQKLLIMNGLVSESQLNSAKAQAAQQSKPLLQVISEMKLVDDEELTKLSAQASAYPYVNLTSITVPQDTLLLLPKETAQSYMAVPFGEMQGRLAVAMLDPANVQAIDFLSRKIGRNIAAFMASRKSLETVLTQYGVDVSKEVSEAIRGNDLLKEAVAGSEEEKPEGGTKKNAGNIQMLVQDAPITRALNTIMDYAASAKASDIHIEPREKDLRIRYRVDGILQEVMKLPKSIEPALVSRVKILSNLKIDEHRIPQDGQFQIKSGGHTIDLRIAIAPVVYGEQVVIRLLDKDDKLLTLNNLGFRGRAFRLITAGIHRPHGMTLSTGPTGSGKTTTMYAAISAIKDVAINIVTLEDPVEYKIDGINQIQVNPDVGLTFASGLRSILRQDPNVVMVGEIRDKETADLAVQAALTGHVVLSTLHTNSAAGVLPRLLDMNIEPYLIASTINTVIGQRLVRKLCEKCRQQSNTTQVEVDSINRVLGKVLPKEKTHLVEATKDLGYDNLPLAGQTAYTLFRAKGCSECTGGYKGRVGIYEVFNMSEAMERLLLKHATTTEVQTQAQTDGMLTMKQDGYLKALAGITSMEEVVRVAADA
ncbi:MAG TPA: ATPase, T2SS/T4P/T4SS family [Candidatus Saccharimonadales bacterium]|nr:ATPase, T2SS/T4P/T4SS family [Candidatus Saccharimonadales bacterium]